MSGNAGFMFYKEYYNDVDWRNLKSNSQLFEDNSKKIKQLKFEKYNLDRSFPQTFILKTTYPGLVIGTGYHHETGVEGEFKIGFYFDYTTGLPVIPGSSVKGLLRSVFPGRGDKYKKERTEYIRELLGKDHEFNVKKLEDEIFEGIRDNGTTDPNKKYLPIYERDIFNDAFPVAVSEEDGLFNDDFITPHKDPLKNPIPLKFLKVSPGVSYLFNFDLKDSNLLTAEEKLKLFLNILLDLGIGAKTNVGYGQFDGSAKNSLISDISKQIAEKEIQEKLESLTPDERIIEERKIFIEILNNYSGKPSKIFDEWTSNNLLKNDKEVAEAMLQIFKNMPSKPQLKQLAKILEIDKSELMKKFKL